MVKSSPNYVVTVIFFFFLERKGKSYTRIVFLFFLTVLFIPLQIFPRKRFSLQNATGQTTLLAIREVFDKLLLFNYDHYLL